MHLAAEPGAVDQDEGPDAGRVGASTWWVRARAGMTHRQLVALCSCPCSSRSVDPEPASRYWVVIPSTVTRRSWTTTGLCRSGAGPVSGGIETADMEPPGV